MTYPLRWLPVQYIPLALNSMAAVFGALVIVLLARSVQLLPHDRTVAQRERERSEFGLLSIRAAWAPVVFAALICAFQISFWENATAAGSSPPFSASGHMFDLLLFAYAVRCILEYRVSERDSWLFKAAFVFGIAIPNDWAMIGFLPLFLTAVIWIKGFAFFNGQFLTRFIAWGLAGLPLYLLLPFINAFFLEPSAPFWTSLKLNVGTQWYVLKLLWAQKQTLAVLSFTSLVPVLFIGFRWSSYFGDTSRTGALLARAVFHVVYGLFLLACVWVAFDPPVSPRNMSLGIPFLTFYYLGALSIGYFAGYFLLVFGTKKASRYARHTPPHLKLINNGLTTAAWVLIVASPVLLFALNLPRIQMANAPLMREYAAAMARDLPTQNTMVLSDDPIRLALARIALAETGRDQNKLFIHTASLRAPDYHSFLNRKYPQRWPSYLGVDRTRPVSELDLIQIVAEVARANTTYYLHPSFGYYFEVFYPIPRGLTLELNFFPTNTAIPPTLSAEIAADNQKFWADFSENTLNRLAFLLNQQNPQARKGPLRRLAEQFHLQVTPPNELVLLGGYCSQSLNFWAAQLQKLDRFQEASPLFRFAHELNDNNVVAKVNHEYNTNLLAGRREPLVLGKHIEEQFGKYRTWNEVLQANGPYDEPGFCYSQGLELRREKNFRQAAQQFHRARTLYPQHATATLALASLYAETRPEDALELIADVRNQPSFMNTLTNLPSLVYVETLARLRLNQLQSADEAVNAALRRASGDNALSVRILESAMQTYVNNSAFTNVQPFIDQLLALSPSNSPALMQKGFVSIQTGNYDDAITALTTFLRLETNNVEAIHTARFNRAIAGLSSGDLNTAQKDYEFLLNTYTNLPQLHFGLGEIARQKNDAATAIHHYERYLANAPAQTEERAAVQQRLNELRSNSP